MLYARRKQSFTDEHTKRPENVVSMHVSMHAWSEMGNYIDKFQYIVHEQK